MRSIFLFVTAQLVLVTLFGQQRVNSCGFKIPPPLPFTQFQSVYEARDILNTMLDTINWKENFSVKEQNGTNNAYATIVGGRRWIIYDNNFLERLDYFAKTKWASISVLAHEMGHHYYNHVVDGKGSTPPKEIQADYFSGVLMAKLGASLNESIAAMHNVASEQGSSSHPGKKDRVDAITNGWNAAHKYDGGSNNTGGGGSNNSGGSGGSNNAGGGNTQTSTNVNDGTWIYLSHYLQKTISIQLSDDGKRYDAVEIKPGEPFIFKYEIYNYGFIRLPHNNNTFRTYRLYHGKDYAIVFSRKQNTWVPVEIP
jgi:uncharacterized membrane protein YgcG